MDNKEDISMAVEREVLEETGVCAEFQRLMTIQENHQIRGPGREGSTDLFCVCLLKPVLDADGNMPQPVCFLYIESCIDRELLPVLRSPSPPHLPLWRSQRFFGSSSSRPLEKGRYDLAVLVWLKRTRNGKASSATPDPQYPGQSPC